MTARNGMNLVPALLLALAACSLLLAAGARAEDGAKEGDGAAKTDQTNAGDAAKGGDEEDGETLGRQRRPRGDAGRRGARAPDVANEHYGAHEAQVFDLWLAKSELGGERFEAFADRGAGGFDGIVAASELTQRGWDKDLGHGESNILMSLSGLRFDRSWEESCWRGRTRRF